MTYEITQSPITAALKASIGQAFAQHSLSMTGVDLAYEPIAFEIQDQGVNVGVCVVQFFWGNLHIQSLIVHPDYRQKGLGKQLMIHALNFAKAQGCAFASVEIMSFQAPEFYQKMGFNIDFKREGYATGASVYYLRKAL